MKAKFIDTQHSPVGVLGTLFSSPSEIAHSSTSKNFYQNPKSDLLNQSETNLNNSTAKKHSTSLQKIQTDSNTPKILNQTSSSLLIRQSTTTLEKLRRRPNGKKNEGAGLRHPKNSMISGQDFGFSSCNSSLVSNEPGSAGKLFLSDKGIISGEDSMLKPSFQRTFINNRSNPSRQYAIRDNPQKIKEYQDRINAMNEKIAKLAGNSMWEGDITQQFQTYSTQTRLALDKAYSKFILFPDIEVDLMEALTSKEASFMKLINLIKGSMNEIFVSNKSRGQQIKVLEEDNKKMRSKLNEEKSKELLIKEIDPIEMRNMYQNSLKNNEKNERVWNVERQQMIAQIQKLTSEIEELRNTNNFSDLKKQYESFQTLVYAKIKDLERDIEEKDVKILKLENLLTRSTMSYKEVQKEFKELQVKHENLSTHYQNYKRDFESSAETQSMYKEMALMSREDLIHTQMRCSSLNDTLNKTTAKFIDAQFKLDKLKREQSEMSIVNEADFQKDSSLLSTIKEAFQNTRRQQLGIRTQNSHGAITVNDPVSVENVQLEKYCYSKPSFYVFIQEEFEAEIIKTEANPEEKVFSIDRESLSSVRAMLDSKYNEFAYYEDARLHSQFPDFVYSWLNSFHVCPIEKRIKMANAEDPAQIRARRINLYKFLMNPKMNKIWDVVTFRDFLEERCAADEVFFYLTCRYILFRGPQLSYYSSCINPIHWIQFDKAEKLIEIILNKLGQEDFNTVKFKLRERAKKKAGKFFIDSGFVLRVLLEFYRNEKRLKLLMLQETFNKVSTSGKNNKPHVTFDVFKQFIEINYSFVSELEKARLYREAWHIGNGKVDYESFFIAANESNFFITALRASVIQKTVTLDTFSLTSEDQIYLQDMNKMISTKYAELFVLFEKTKNFARLLGIENIVSSAVQLENVITKKFDSAFDETKGHGLYLLFNQLIQMYQRIRNQYFLTYRNTPTSEYELAKNDMKSIDIMMESISRYAVLDQADYMEKHNKARKFQTYYRRRRDGWYGLMTTLLQKVRSKEKKDTHES